MRLRETRCPLTAVWKLCRPHATPRTLRLPLLHAKARGSQRQDEGEAELPLEAHLYYTAVSVSTRM